MDIYTEDFNEVEAQTIEEYISIEITNMQDNFNDYDQSKIGDVSRFIKPISNSITEIIDNLDLKLPYFYHEHHFIFDRDIQNTADGFCGFINLMALKNNEIVYVEIGVDFDISQEGLNVNKSELNAPQLHGYTKEDLLNVFQQILNIQVSKKVANF